VSFYHKTINLEYLAYFRVCVCVCMFIKSQKLGVACCRFHVACALGNAQIVELLLKETDDVNDLTIQGKHC